MRGNKKRELDPIFERFRRSKEAQRAHTASVIRKRIAEIVESVQEILGIENTGLNNDDWQSLMIYIHGLLDMIEDYELSLDDILPKLESLTAEIDAKDRMIQLQEEMIELLKKLASVRKEEQQELLDKIDQLEKEKEELDRKTRQSKKSDQKEKLSPEEARRRVEANLKRCQKRMEELGRALEDLQNVESETPGPEDVEPSASREEGDNTGDHSPQSDASEAQPSPTAEDDGTEASAEDTQSEEEPVDSQQSHDPTQDNVETQRDQSNEDNNQADTDSKSNEQPGEQDAREDPEKLERQIEEKNEQLEQQKRDLEEANYQAHRDNKTGNTPSGKMGPWNTAKPAPIHRDNSGNHDDPQINKVDEKEQRWREEEQSEWSALHDPDKSPNKSSGDGRRGKPPGSEGGGRTIPLFDRTEERRCEPTKCQTCPHRESCQALHNAQPVGQVRNVYDMEIVRVLFKYRMVSCQCPMEDGKTITGSFPEGVNNWFQYGNVIRSLAVTLNTVGMVSYDRIADILKGMIDDKQLCGTTINSWVKKTAEKLHPAIRYIKAAVFSGAYLHSDESGVKVKGVLHWIHTACNMMFTYLRVDRQRGDNAMKRIGILNAYMGTLITDCLASYWDKGTRHGLCNAHLLRELFALVKFFDRDKEWAQKMYDLMKEMNEARDKLKEAQETQFPAEQLEDFYRRYDEIVKEGMKQHPDSEAMKSKRGKSKQTRGRNLLDRLKEKKENFLLFLIDFSVPFTNNEAERSLRLVSIKRSVVGGFDSYEGADDFAVIWSFISSARKHGLSSFDAIKAAVEDRAVKFLFDEDEIQELEAVAANLDEINMQQFLDDRAKDKEELRKVKENAEAKQKAAEHANAKAVAAEEKANLLKAEAHDGNAKKAMRAEKAILAAQKAKKIAVEKQLRAEKANEDVKDLYEYLKWRANAALYFLEISDSEWDFEKEMVC